jgi:hypothetical protein
VRPWITWQQRNKRVFALFSILLPKMGQLNWGCIMKIEGLSHMTFVCKNLDRTTALFKQVFQAEEVYSLSLIHI